MDRDWRAQRIQRNEETFREINQRLEADLRKVRGNPDLQEFVCECGDRECGQLIRLSFDEFRAIRADERHFAVVPGHVFPDVERVVDGNERFDVVEKKA